VLLAEENFSDASHVITRIPTPLFGLGLIEAFPDRILDENVARSASKTLGFQGTLNRSGNNARDSLRVENSEQVTSDVRG
jgi:hypothetical protein